MSQDPRRDGGRRVRGPPMLVSTRSPMISRSRRPNSDWASMSRSPGARLEPLETDVVGAVEQEEVDVPDPAAGRQVHQVVGQHGAQEHRWRSCLGDSVGDRQPCATECRPPNRLIATEGAGRVEQQVDVEGHTPSGEEASEGSEDRRLARARSARDHEERQGRHRLFAHRSDTERDRRGDPSPRSGSRTTGSSACRQRDSEGVGAPLGKEAAIVPSGVTEWAPSGSGRDC